jgi:uncharacterized protein (TIGR02996 family)
VIDEQIRAAFLADILANPDDDGPRLVFADWLAQQGDPRGELINVQCALVHATGAERARLVNRSSDLLSRHGTWLDEIRSIVRGVETKRGFVASINATARVFAKHCGPLFEREPIQELRVTKPMPRDLATLAKTPHLARLRSLAFIDSVTLDLESQLRMLGNLLAKLAHLRSLDLRLAVNNGCEAAARAVLAAAKLPALVHLKLLVRGNDATAIVAGLASAELPALSRLTVRGQHVAVLRPAFPTVEITSPAD